MIVIFIIKLIITFEKVANYVFELKNIFFLALHTDES